MTYDGILLGRAARFGDESTHPVETDVKKETWAYTRLQSPWPSHLHSSTSTRKGLCFDVSTCNPKRFLFFGKALRGTSGGNPKLGGVCMRMHYRTF
ncbi:uncharacterized protein LAJ45_10517 [Morchella importuna]|uniref:uncharacterized protein n=1 Tax=Morchella importuna TaxID=1174673 RepID=UPI001E8D91CA|nr:uncharacterized protein LAJ45_10517 [Morchella importuna]KAH8145547.1 hypothetical protein LAJ45_10517 [Morchella importuna]